MPRDISHLVRAINKIGVDVFHVEMIDAIGTQVFRDLRNNGVASRAESVFLPRRQNVGRG